MVIGPIQGIVFVWSYNVDLSFYQAIAVALWLIGGLLANGVGLLMALAAAQEPEADPQIVRRALVANGLAFGLILLGVLYTLIVDPMGPHLR